MLGGKHEAIAWPMNNREREHEHFVLVVLFDTSCSVHEPDRHVILEQELVNSLFDLVHVEGTCGLIEVHYQLPAVDFLHFLRC